MPGAESSPRLDTAAGSGAVALEAEVQPAGRMDPSPSLVTSASPEGPLARRLAQAAADRAAHLLVGYRVRPSLFGPRLWALRLEAPDLLLSWSPPGRQSMAAGGALARAILIHFLDREPTIVLVTRFRARFLERLRGPEFTIPAAAVRGFLAAQGVPL